MKFRNCFILTAVLICTSASAQVACNQFELIIMVTGSVLDLSVDTDLPDDTKVWVSVSRSYFEKGNPDEYSIDYFSGFSTVGKWRSKHSISIADKKWESALEKKQEEMSRLGIGFDVASISDKITVGMGTPINQSNPRFGERNLKLGGEKVKSHKAINAYRTVEAEIEVYYPLDSSTVGRPSYPSLDPVKLDIGQEYIVSEQTSLMPSHNPADPLAALQHVKQIPEGGIFKVLEVAKNDEYYPWYKVIAFDQRKKQIGTGWINSLALVGQELKAFK